MTKVSILMAVYNAEFKLSNTIQSIKNQSLKDFECIIVDDGSEDRTLEYLNQLDDNRFKVIRSSHQGLTKSLNLGLRKCSSEYVARIDADDQSSSDRIKKQSEYLDKYKDIVAVGSSVQILNNKNSIIREVNYPTSHHKLKKMYTKKMNSLPHSSLMLRKDKLIELGGYREIFKKAQDYDLVLRLTEIGKIGSIKKPLCQLRYDNNSITNNLNGNLQVEYSVMALISHYYRNIYNKDPLSDKSTSIFLDKFAKWYESSIYPRTFLSRIARNNMKKNLSEGKIFDLTLELFNSLKFDMFWPIRTYLGYDFHLKKWVKNNY